MMCLVIVSPQTIFFSRSIKINCAALNSVIISGIKNNERQTNMFKNTFIALVALSISSVSYAEYGMKRANTWEASIAVISQDGDDYTSSNSNSSLSVESADGWGFSLGYNPSNHLLLNWEFATTSPRYKVTAPDGGSLSQKADVYDNQFNATWHFFEGPFTPYVKAGMGWTTVDSNVSTGQIYCSPGYYYWYCDSSTYGDSGFSYNAAVGVRYDINRSVFVRASVESLWSGSDIAGETPQINTGKIELGFRM
jgi:outer membrane protein W